MNKYKVVKNENESVIVESALNFSDFNKTVFSGYVIEQLNDSNVCIKIGFGMNVSLDNCDLFNVLKKAEVKKTTTFTNSIIEGVMVSFINKGVKMKTKSHFQRHIRRLQVLYFKQQQQFSPIAYKTRLRLMQLFMLNNSQNQL